MKKDNLLLTLLAVAYLALGLSATAQPLVKLTSETADTNNVRIEVDGVDLEDGMIEALTKMLKVTTQEATKLSAQIAEVKQLEAQGLLTAEQAEERIAQLNEEFEARMENEGEKMEEWGEAFGERMEKWGEEFGKKWESNMEALDGLDSLTENEEEKLELKELRAIISPLEDAEDEANEGKEKKTKFFDTSFSFYSSGLTNSRGELTATDSLFSRRGTSSFAYRATVKQKLGGSKSPLLIEWGFGFAAHSLTFKDAMTLTKNPTDANQTQFVPIQNYNMVRRSSVSLGGLEVPVMLHLDASPEGSINKSFSLGVGGYAGVRMNPQSQILGTDASGARLTSRTSNNYNINRFYYGLRAEAGWKSFKMTAQLDANPLFQSAAVSEDVYVGGIGLSIVF